MNLLQRAATAALLFLTCGDVAPGRPIADLALQGLFGWRGPRLCAAAVAQEEGVDHSWVFRYEQPIVEMAAP